ncbi:MAG: ATP-binding protein [Bacteroidota bacterium]
MLNKLINILNNLSTGTRTAISYFTIIFFTLLASITAILLLQYSKGIDEKLSKSFNPAINAAEDIHSLIDESNRLCYSLITQPNKDIRLKLEKIISKQYKSKKIFLLELFQEPELQKSKVLFNTADASFIKIIEKQKQLLIKTKDSIDIEGAKALQLEIKDDIAALQPVIGEVELKVIDASREIQLEKYESYRTLRFALLAMMVVVVMVAAISLLITNETIVNPVRQVSEVLNVMGKGDIVKFEVTTRRKDEIGDMIESAQNLSLGMKNKADVAYAIGKGNYEIEVPLQGKNDKLGKALLEMRDNLLQSKKTEEKNLRELELYTKNLEKKNKELDQFAYVTSHDLKSPLRGINNLAEWIEEDMGDTMSIESKKYFLMLRGRVHRMESLINSLLKYSRAGRSSNELELVSSKQILLEVLKRIAPSPRFAIYHDDALPTLYANYKEIEDVFFELLSNAVRYNFSAEPVINITYKIEKPFYVFCVADNGSGISPEYHKKIFTIFQTLETRDKIESMGAGLAIVSKIVEENGGYVWVESDEGLGAKFYFKWPIPKESVS